MTWEEAESEVSGQLTLPGFTAVTTIVAREKNSAGAAAIGAAWGIGHTLTILVVGGGIVLFGWVGD
jgi:hypothetical protein